MSELEFEPFHRVAEIDRFSCGASHLDKFIQTEEVEKYHEQGYGDTTLVWRDHSVVGYYTVGRGELDAEWLKVGQKSFTTRREFVEDNIPAMKIGRLAVDRHIQKKGLGRIILVKIATETMEMTPRPPILVVRANPDSIEFYEKFGFQPVTKRPKKATSGSMTLFFVLDTLGPNDIRGEVDL